MIWPQKEVHSSIEKKNAKYFRIQMELEWMIMWVKCSERRKCKILRIQLETPTRETLISRKLFLGSKLFYFKGTPYNIHSVLRSQIQIPAKIWPVSSSFGASMGGGGGISFKKYHTVFHHQYKCHNICDKLKSEKCSWSTVGVKNIGCILFGEFSFLSPKHNPSTKGFLCKKIT